MVATFDPRLIYQMSRQQGPNMFDVLTGAVNQYSAQQRQQEAELKAQKEAAMKQMEAERKEALKPTNVMGQAALYGVESLDPEQRQVFAGKNLEMQSQIMIDPLTKEAMPARRDLYGLLSGGRPAPRAAAPAPSAYGTVAQGLRPDSGTISPTTQIVENTGDFADPASQPDIPLDEVMRSEAEKEIDLSQAPQIPMPDTTGMSRAEAFEARRQNRQQNEDLKVDFIKEQQKTAKSERKRLDPREYSEGQLKSAGFASRMSESEDIIESLLQEDPMAQQAKTGVSGGVQSVLKGLPLGEFGTQAGAGLVKMTATPEQQQYLNAAENWIRANLRLESGAVIGADEKADEYATYFPMPLDTDEVIEQKKKLRQSTMKAVKNQSAGSFDVLYGDKKKETANSDPLGLFN